MNIEPINPETQVIIDRIKEAMAYKTTFVNVKTDLRNKLKEQKEQYETDRAVLEQTLNEYDEKAIEAESEIQRLYKDYHAIVNSLKKPQVK